MRIHVRFQRRGWYGARGNYGGGKSMVRVLQRQSNHRNEESGKWLRHWQNGALPLTEDKLKLASSTKSYLWFLMNLFNMSHNKTHITIMQYLFSYWHFIFKRNFQSYLFNYLLWQLFWNINQIKRKIVNT